jgi:hypothetical protein
MATRTRIAGLGGAAAILEAGLGVVALMAFGPTEIAFYALCCAVATVAVTVGLWRLLDVGADGGEEGDGGLGGGGDRGGGPPEPSWWPAFERDFRAHARERQPSRAHDRSPA